MFFFKKIDTHEKAKHFFEKKNYLRAIEELDKMKENTVNDEHDCFYLKALCFAHMNSDVEALNCLNESIKLNPKNFDPYFAKGCLLRKQNNHVESLEL